MIFRIWHGWAEPKDAKVLEKLWKNEILPTIRAKQMNGFLGMQLLRRDLPTEVEFTTMIRFQSIEDIKQFAGENIEKAVIPAPLQKLLKRWDERCIHCEAISEVSSIENWGRIEKPEE